MKKFYLTTAIDYANGSPHLGHAYEKILADVIARIKRLQGTETRFVTGLDEHGQKVQQGADAEGIEPQQRCDRIAEEFKEILSTLKISNDDYIRTTEARHKKVVCERYRLQRTAARTSGFAKSTCSRNRWSRLVSTAGGTRSTT